MAKSAGLTRLQLPAGLDPEVAAEVAKSANATRGEAQFAHVVRQSPSEGEISPEEAIKVRTREDGKSANALLVHQQGEFKELKSLEAFRLANPGSLPSGLLEEGEGELQSATLLEEVALLCPDLATNDAQRSRLAGILKTVLLFLLDAYRAVGNDEVNWTDAWWRHVDTMLSKLTSVGQALPSAHGLNRMVIAVYAAAGLPIPDNQTAGVYSRTNSGKKFAKIIGERWGSSNSAEAAIKDIRDIERKAKRLAADAEHSLARLEWEDLAATRARLRHPVLACCFHGHGSNDWLDGWASTSETAFFSGAVVDSDDILLGRLDEDGLVPLPCVPGLDASNRVHVLAVRDADFDRGNKQWLGTFGFELPYSAQFDGVAPSFEVDCNPRALVAENVRVEPSGDKKLLVFDLELRLPGGTWRENPSKITATPQSDSAREVLRGKATIQLVIAHPGRGSTWLVEHPRGKSAKARLLSHSTTKYSINDGKIVPVEIGRDETPLFKLGKSTASFEVISAGLDAPLTLSSADREWQPDITEVHNEELPLSRSEPLRADVDLQLTLGGHIVDIQVPEVSEEHLSPFTACATNEAVANDIDGSIMEELERDPRCDLEKWLASEFVLGPATPAHPGSLGILAVAAERQTRSVEPSFDASMGYFAAGTVPGAPRLQDGIADLDEVQDFWRGFQELGLGEIAGASGGPAAWPSRLDLRLLDKGKVENYLEAYGKLLGQAHAFQPSMLLAFPFSIPIVAGGDLEGILLSPLHPLRLGWSWSVQNSAANALSTRSSREVHDLLRFVDGLGFPLIAPSVEEEHLLSVPLDPKLNGVFSAWSFLAARRATRNGTGTIPTILGRRFPFGAASGLDRGGVASALRDFLRVNPLVTQLNVGLHAADKVERATELDQALIDAVGRELADGMGRLPGGVRIYDSPNRLGELPEPEAVIASIEDTISSARRGTDRSARTPHIEWATADTGDLDVQFLETPLVRVEVGSTGQEKPDGAAPRLPINRQIVWSREGSGTQRSAYCPVLPENSFQDLRFYGHCLHELETLASHDSLPRVSCRLAGVPALTGSTARWTVSGNAHMDPANLSRELGQISSELVLWEWRPAFLARLENTSRSSVATARPYITISRLDDFFRQELEDDCRKALGETAKSSAQQVLTELGTRGIGLSSLLSIGHTQTSGAIGFFLAFRALKDWEERNSDDDIRCILPMDAIHPVLEAIAGEDWKPDDRRRADVLAVRARKHDDGTYAVILHPVEVKMRSDDGNFPSPRSSQIEEALGQLANSSKLLASLAARVNDGDDVLLNNAVASLLEAALSIRAVTGLEDQRGEVEKERDFLNAVAEGRCDVNTSTGTLFWFQAGGQSLGSRPIEERVGDGADPWQVLLNPLHYGNALVADEPSEAHAPFTRALDRDAIGRCDESRPGTDPAIDTEGKNENQGDQRGVQSAEHPNGDQGTGSDGSHPSVDVPTQLVGTGDHSRPSERDFVKKPPEKPREQEDETLDGVKIHVGTRASGTKSEKVVFDPSNTAVNQLNMGVLGDLGTGKTQFLRSFVYQLSQSADDNGGRPPKAFIFDYKTDYIDEEFLESVNGKLLAPGDEPIPLNFFALPRDAKKNAYKARARFFADVIDKVNRIGTVQRQRLVDCVQRAYEYFGDGEYPLVSDILEMYREQVPTPDSVTSALSDLVDLEVFETDRGNLLTIEELFDRTVVVDLKGMQAGAHVQSVLVILLIDLLFSEYMPSRPKVLRKDANGVQRRLIDSFLLVDEAHHIMAHDFEVLNQLMLQGRQFGMGVVLSSQYLSHFKQSSIDWSQPLLTWCIHKVPRISAKDLQGIGFTGDNAALAEQVPQLEPLHSIFKTEPDLMSGTSMRDKPYFEFFE
ncbi:hypothetical protein N8I71_17810 [Roseibacterium sp. SDUM158016]|uniref:hypothetical protein n=1 Tax=Roseicyclus sediminis TaxID=2980997 RepID=UPI0021D38681|nr:hypothetical protein [Roseibacterium sp. SDUM158016]MCU4654699.1 hypothetical protein [Roseibacterium sp. SDUM158016]